KGLCLEVGRNQGTVLGGGKEPRCCAWRWVGTKGLCLEVGRNQGTVLGGG
ncbi:unnamed protein product, partial [Staurois parvus]